ncbi:MAG TPA: hypothetical protein VFD90_00840 [Gaiellales bacterium]|nr:hypothetical protein [Gaiellales bacterium]
MRATGCLCALLGALLAVLPVTVVQAKVKPLPKPAGISPKPALRTVSVIAPVSRPTASTTVVRPARREVASRPRTSVRRTRVRRISARAPRRHVFVPASIRGGRERNWLVESVGGRDSARVLAVALLRPTPLGLVGSGEALPVHDRTWPAWKIAALALLAAAETFLLVRLTRGRGFAYPNEI